MAPSLIARVESEWYDPVRAFRHEGAIASGGRLMRIQLSRNDAIIIIKSAISTVPIP
jgi:hypothetical protein